MIKTKMPSTGFASKLQQYKQLIDNDIASYSKQAQKTTLQQFGANARLETDAYLSILGRGGKRIRGALVMEAYAMSGGTNQAMILQAARAIEMLHAYILIIDDFQDRSLTRRGGPSAHVLLADYHRHNSLAGDSDHFGASVALNAATAGAHAAQMVLANLDVDAELRLKAISIINRTMLVTSHGQTGDIINEVVAKVSVDDIERVLEWKTACYTILNPLHVGMVLAGADCHATDAITDYSMNTGKAFQITDDLLGIFGNEFQSGKSPMDDIKEGKRTVITAYALDHTTNGNKNFLIQMLGNIHLTPAEFERCKTLIIASGADVHAQKRVDAHITAAIASLDEHAHHWSPDGVQFLRELAQYLSKRTS